jgi:hypothetical protein
MKLLRYGTHANHIHIHINIHIHIHIHIQSHTHTYKQTQTLVGAFSEPKTFHFERNSGVFQNEIYQNCGEDEAILDNRTNLT